MGILTQHMYKAPVPIRALVPPPVNPADIPPGLDAIVLKCMSKKPDARFASMDELIADIEKFERGVIPDALPEMMGRSGGFNVPADYFRGMPAPLPATPAARRKRWGIYAGLAGIATAMAIVVFILARSSTTTAHQAPIATPVVAAPIETNAPA